MRLEHQADPSRPLAKPLVWIKELRAPFFTATIVPVLLGATVAWHRFGLFDATRFMLTLMAALCLHAGANMINDYFDFESGCDLHPAYKEFWAPFFGGSRLLPDGVLRQRDVYAAALLSFGLGGSIGFFLAYMTGWIILLLGLIGVLSSYFYVRHLAPKGVGELLVGLNFGPLMAMGSYYAQVQTLTIEPLVASFPVGILIASVLWVNEIPDYVADKSVGKNTLVVRLGRRKAADTYAVLMAAAYAIIVLGVGLGLMPTYSLIALITAPIALSSARVTRKYYDEPFKMVSANASTILVHLFSGSLLTAGYLIDAILGL